MYPLQARPEPGGTRESQGWADQSARCAPNLRRAPEAGAALPRSGHETRQVGKPPLPVAPCVPPPSRPRPPRVSPAIGEASTATMEQKGGATEAPLYSPRAAEWRPPEIVVPARHQLEVGLKSPPPRAVSTRAAPRRRLLARKSVDQGLRPPPLGSHPAAGLRVGVELPLLARQTIFGTYTEHDSRTGAGGFTGSFADAPPVWPNAFAHTGGTNTPDAGARAGPGIVADAGARRQHVYRRHDGEVGRSSCSRETRAADARRVQEEKRCCITNTSANATHTHDIANTNANAETPTHVFL